MGNSKMSNRKKNSDKTRSLKSARKAGAETKPAVKLRIEKATANVDLRAIARMLDWQLELLGRLRVLTLSAMEIVESGSGKPKTR